MTDNTDPVIRKYCHKSGRRFGWFNTQSYSVDELPEIQLAKCKLVEEESLARSTPVGSGDSVSILEQAKSVLRKRSPHQLEVRVWNFADDRVSRDSAIIERTRNEASIAYEEFAETLSEQYGNPIKSSAKAVSRVPVCGIEQCVIWQIKEKKLYLVASFEDVGLPYRILLGAM